MRLFRHQNLTDVIIAILCGLVCSLDIRLQDDFFGLRPSEFLERIPRFSEHGLSKRDVCSDAIPGTVTQTCTPGNTLCCVPSTSDITFPRCQDNFGKGFCCVEDSHCYIDVASNCAATGAIRCTMLAENVEEACCPQFTSCATSLNQSTIVRCNLELMNPFLPSSSPLSSLGPQDSQDSGSSTSPSSLSSTSLSLTTTSTPTPQPPSSSASLTSASPTSSSATAAPEPVAKPLSAGAAAGIGIGSAAGVLGTIGLGFWLYRRGQRSAGAREADAAKNSYSSPSRHMSFDKPAELGHVYNHGGYQGGGHNKYELSGGHPMGVAELDSYHR